MSHIKVYTKRFCAYCTAAKQLLSSRNYQFEEISLEGNAQLMMEVMQKSGQRTAPQIFIDEYSVGGYQELVAAIASGEFAERSKDG